jgi:hypothetical protein
MTENLYNTIVTNALLPTKVETFITKHQFEEYRDAGKQGVYYWIDGDRKCLSMINFLGKEDFRKYF